MKKLAMSALFLMLLFGSAVAHDGALGLFTSGTLGACNAPLGMFATDTIMMYYLRDDGPDLGKALEFRIEISIAEAFVAGYEWNSQIVLEYGDIMSGISITGATCLGSNQTEVYIGSLYILYAGMFDDEKFYVGVKEDPAVQPPGIYITLCLEGNPMWAVLGGEFVFNGECSTGVKETSWGAIKELYR